MDTGEINVSSHCFAAYEQMRRDKKYRYLILCVNRKGNEIEIEHIGDRGQEHDKFLRDMQRGGPHTCRCGLYDMEYSNVSCNGSKVGVGPLDRALSSSAVSLRQNLVLFMWCPPTATFKNRARYGRVFNVLRRSFAGVQACLKATDLHEASRDGIIKHLRQLELQG